MGEEGHYREQEQKGNTKTACTRGQWAHDSFSKKFMIEPVDGRASPSETWTLSCQYVFA